MQSHSIPGPVKNGILQLKPKGVLLWSQTDQFGDVLIILDLEELPRDDLVDDIKHRRKQYLLSLIFRCLLFHSNQKRLHWTNMNPGCWSRLSPTCESDRTKRKATPFTMRFSWEEWWIGHHIYSYIAPTILDQLEPAIAAFMMIAGNTSWLALTQKSTKPSASLF